ncbi:MAG: D-alanyl-D-alanine carboxypeptidase, partial [Oscillospiraceae bacterium]|nr:D-alanyl-D-alanine carboxypeptidase [Oscillospiraceae bacterium]
MKKFKRIVACLAVFSIFLSSIPAYAAFTPTHPVNSQAAYMVNTDTGTVIYEKNADKRMYPASLTKIMTAIIAMEQTKDLDKTVVTAPSYIFDELYGQNASNADIRQGEKVTMRDLLYACILPSACEAGSIIADYIGKGSIPDFTAMMNEKAKELGATGTNFVNAHGLFDASQYTTAKDMYLITKYAMSVPGFLEIAGTYKHTMKATNKHSEKRNIYHTNLLLKNNGTNPYYYPYAKGIKTGTLDESGRNLISIASKDGYNYLLVTLGAPMSDPSGKILCYNDAINLYEWAFSRFKVKAILKTTETVG